MNGTNLDEIISAEKKEYYRKWRAKNRDKVKKHNEAYWKKKARQKLQSATKTEKAGE